MFVVLSRRLHRTNAAFAYWHTSQLWDWRIRMLLNLPIYQRKEGRRQRWEMDKGIRDARDSVAAKMWDEVLAFVTVIITVFWNATPCSLVQICWVFVFYSKTNQMLQCLNLILFLKNTVHVSDGLSARYQEIKTVLSSVNIYRVWLIVMNGRQRNARYTQIWGKQSDSNYDGNCTASHCLSGT